MARTNSGARSTKKGGEHMDLYNLVVSAKLSKGGGGGDIDVDALTVTENGVYTASSGHAYSPVTVSVPQSGITPTGTSVITENGLYDVANFASASVSVPIPSGYIQPTGTSSITANGIYDITSFASVDVNVSGGGGGGITADDIAMRLISGVVSGSATRIGNYAFYGCSALTTASFPDAVAIGNSAFQSCRNLISVYFPKVSTIAANAFTQCSSLSVVSFPNLESDGAIASSAFTNCSQLMSVYLLGSNVARIASTNVFTNTPLSKSTYTGSFGSIYVPVSLVETYKTTGWWPSYANRITAYVE